MSPPTAHDRARAIRDALPAHGLFHEKSWRVSPDPFPLGEKLTAELNRLGHQLVRFTSACAQLYRMSADGRQPAWIAGLLDRGKPPELIAAQRHRASAPAVPKVIRPDLILTDEGFVISELDSVPGGIGLTAWLGERYSAFFPDLLGGETGMLDGFEAILPGGEIIVSEEANTYLPEMDWLAAALNSRAGSRRWSVVGTAQRTMWSKHVYRFFELFDLDNVACWKQLAAMQSRGEIEVTPPFKPALEEKMWFALFWLKPLESFWRRALGDRIMGALKKCIPYTWLVDPQPLPPHAVLPRLEAHAWAEVAAYSQKERELILKISGFSERAWGARGVVLGSDVSGQHWKESLNAALEEWSASPHILQVFHRGRHVEHPYLEGGEIRQLRGRVRLCPYYFAPDQGEPILGGALATICPDNKKLLHGMPEAILTPSRTGNA